MREATRPVLYNLTIYRLHSSLHCYLSTVDDYLPSNRVFTLLFQDIRSRTAISCTGLTTRYPRVQPQVSHGYSGNCCPIKSLIFPHH